MTEPDHLEIKRKTFDYSDSVRINYYEIGRGDKTIILLHGFSASALTWDTIWESFPEKYSVIAFDLKGFEYSSKPDDQYYSPVDQADIVIRFIKARNLSNVVLVGNSYGGGVALIVTVLLLKSDSKYIEKLILIGSAGYDRKLPFFIDLSRKRPWLGRLILQFVSSRTMMSVSLKRAYHNKSKVTDNRIIKYAQFYDLPGSRRATANAARYIFPDNFDEIRSQFPIIRIPVLIIWGDQDKVIPVADAYLFHKILSQSYLTIIPECGHMPQEESPDETIRAINNFLEKTN